VQRTKTDPASIARDRDDEPSQLREWGTDRVYLLPPRATNDWLIGSGSGCWLQLQDNERFVSRRHAAIRRADSRWLIVDIGSKNGLWIDGRRVDSTPLTPGIEIGIGRVRLIVESRAVVRRRHLLARLLGWKRERQVVVDRALRVLRELAAFRTPAWLSGTDDLRALARLIHRDLHGEEQPFVPIKLSAITAPDESLRSAQGGTLCIGAGRGDARRVYDLISEREPQCSVIVCAYEPDQAMSIHVPPLETRRDELGRVIREFGADAIARLRAKPTSFTDADADLLLAHRPETLAEIEVATLRLVAIREFGGVTHAAPQLGITHSALSKWVARRTTRRRQD